MNCAAQDKFDRVFALVPAAVFFWASVLSPLIAFALGYADLDDTLAQAGTSPERPENRFIWPALAAASLILAARFRFRLARTSLPSSLILLLAYMLLAGVSAFWAYEPELSFRRFVQQTTVLISVVLPVLLSSNRSIIIRDVFICFAIACILNLGFVIVRPATAIGHAGYFDQKNGLGELAAVALIFALHETTWPQHRRFQGIATALIAAVLLVASQSKTSLIFALFAPAAAGLMIGIARFTRISPAISLIYAGCLGMFSYLVISAVFKFDFGDAAMLVFGDPTLTGRTTIWEFAAEMISRKPLFGWGYRSFWLIGPLAPSVVEAPEWVAEMPHAHNGYLDIILQTGYAGFVLVLLFIVFTVHGVLHIAGREPRRAWLSLSLVVFTVLYNFLESTWVYSSDVTWVLVAMVASEGPINTATARRARGSETVPDAKGASGAP